MAANGTGSQRIRTSVRLRAGASNSASTFSRLPRHGAKRQTKLSAMARILFVYEFGAGLGHLSILSAVARPFVREHQVAFAGPDLPLATSYLTPLFGEAIRVHQAPRWSPAEARIREVGTFCHTLAETLYLFAFDEEIRLRLACDTWSRIVEAERPDVVVADSAPTARLALEAKVPMVVVGTGYTVLPGSRVLPSLRPWQREVTPRSRSVEARICASVNDQRTTSRGKPVDYLGDLFRGDATFVSTLPEFDPYAAFRGSDPYVPFAIPDSAIGRPFADRTGTPIFAYLPGVHPAVPPVIEALNEIDHASRLYVSNVDPAKVARLCRSHVRIHATPVDLSTILPECKVVIHHAGLGTTLSAMVAGTPQLTLPAMLENQITGEGLERSGSSINLQIPPVPAKDDIVSRVRTLIADPRFEKAGHDSALRMQEFNRSVHLKMIIDVILDFISRR